MVVHTFLWVVPGHCLRAGFMESRNFFCLTSYPGEISLSNSANRELFNDVLVVVVRRRKVALHTSSHLSQLKRDEVLFPPLPISLANRNGLKNLTRQIFSPCVKFGGNLCRDVETA